MKPSHAPSVWFEDQTLCVELPGLGEHKHTIRLEGPDNWPRLFQMLQHRTGETTIGEPGDPTQAQLEKEIMKKVLADSNIKARRVGTRRQNILMSVDQRSKVDEILREMGLCS